MSTTRFTYSQFITRWVTNSSNEQITIPTTTSSEDYNFIVDWGDGTVENIAGADPSPSHTYSSAGEYIIRITADPDAGQSFPQIYFNDNGTERIQELVQWGSINWQDMNAAFNGCSNLKITAGDKPDLSNVTSMNEAFAEVLLVDNTQNWDTSNVESMASTFVGEGSIGDITEWDTSNVTDMSSMFSNRFFGNTNNFNQDISGWDTSNVTDMSSMFESAANFNQDISSWDVSNVTNMNRMFSQASSFNQNLGTWDVSNVADMSIIFGSTNNLTDKFVAKTIAGWVDPATNAGGNDVTNMQLDVPIFLDDYDYNDFAQYTEVVRPSTGETAAQVAVQDLCSIRNWDIRLQNGPSECA